MTVLERIKSLCRTKKNISITTLEQTLGYSNGSLAKAKDIPSSRIMEIANFLEVSVEYLMTGNDNRFSIENAELMADIMLNNEMLETIKKFQKLNNEKKKHIIELIMMFSENGE